MELKDCDWETLYHIIAQRLIAYGVVTQEQCNTIARVGHRKQRYWRRHILDLCSFVLESKHQDIILSQQVKQTCMAGIKIAKGNYD